MISLFQYVNERFFSPWLIANSYWLNAETVENIGVEPMTSCVQGRRSSQLS